MPWRLDKLSYILYEMHLASTLGNKTVQKSIEEIRKSAAFHELNGFLLAEFIELPVDSIQIVSGLEYYNPETRSVLTDTAFIFTYQPASIGKAGK